MLTKRLLPTSYSRLLAVSTLIGLSGGALSLVLFLFRQQCEPLVSIILPYLTRSLFDAGFYYHPHQYYWIAAYVGTFAIIWTAVMLILIARKPLEDRRIDAALLGKLHPHVRGAPIDPE